MKNKQGRAGGQKDKVLQRSNDSGSGQGLEVVMGKWVQSGGDNVLASDDEGVQ